MCFSSLSFSLAGSPSLLGKKHKTGLTGGNKHEGKSQRFVDLKAVPATSMSVKERSFPDVWKESGVLRKTPRSRENQPSKTCASSQSSWFVGKLYILCLSSAVHLL